MATVKNWFNEFQRGRTSVFDEPRPGAPKRATTEDNETKIRDLVLGDRRLKIREIAETVGMSKDRVGHILHEILGMRKLSARWVSRLLTPDNKRNRETTSEQCFTLFKRNPKEFLHRFVTVDETWIHYRYRWSENECSTPTFLASSWLSRGSDFKTSKKSLLFLVMQVG